MDTSSETDYFCELKQKMNLSHEIATQGMEMKSQKIKMMYDRKIRQLCYKPSLESLAT